MEKFIMNRMKDFAKETVNLEGSVSKDRTEKNLRTLMEHEEAFSSFLENIQNSGTEGVGKANAINMVYQALLNAYRIGSDVPTIFCSNERYPAFLPEALKTAGITRFRYVEEPNSIVFHKFEDSGFRFAREVILETDESTDEALEAEDSLIEEELAELN